MSLLRLPIEITVGPSVDGSLEIPLTFHKEKVFTYRRLKMYFFFICLELQLTSIRLQEMFTCGRRSLAG